MNDLLVLIGYTPKGCVATDCPMFGEGCGLEDSLILAIHLNVLGDPHVREELRQQGYPLHLVVTELPPAKGVAKAA